MRLKEEITKRTTIILREIGQEHKEEVEKMLNGGPKYLDLKYGLNDSWYVTYDTEEHTQAAYVHLQNIEIMFNNRPICARIKAGGPPANIDQQMQQPTIPEPSDFPPMMDLGQILAAYGFVPVATYRPGSTVVHVEEETERTPTVSRQPFRFSNGAARNNGTKKQNGHNHHNNKQNQRYYDEGGSTSSASSGVLGGAAVVAKVYLFQQEPLIFIYSHTMMPGVWSNCYLQGVITENLSPPHTISPI
ncbi:unnamed protein product [Caenorhabditis angaria]|uniref:LARP4/4B RNA recognition motif domain-containing protein n=1 Tax=Caenorhabditis angaria TaxID=860376 RepID=A0A9P1I5X3_9PELO|nr:unnamed protein product [Caenorhabditis angaria]